MCMGARGHAPRWRPGRLNVPLMKSNGRHGSIQVVTTARLAFGPDPDPQGYTALVRNTQHKDWPVPRRYLGYGVRSTFCKRAGHVRSISRFQTKLRQPYKERACRNIVVALFLWPSFQQQLNPKHMVNIIKQSYPTVLRSYGHTSHTEREPAKRHAALYVLVAWQGLGIQRYSA